MNETVVFRVNGKAFHSAITGSNELVVRSMPRSYRVVWDEQTNPVKKINETLASHPNNLLFIDEAVFALYGKDIEISADRVMTVPATEKNKSLEGANALFDFLYQHQFTKGETLVVVGGGIIQDLGGFASACYKRGIRWVLFPTTLLSMCDSCIGGKASLNYKEGKNQIGLFSPPHEVIINPQFLKTLSDDALASGLGEILKIVIMGGKEFLSLYRDCVKEGRVQSEENYRALILAALNLKRAIVEEDEFESDHRKCLNYGHTLGHAIEVLSDYAIPHGIAIVCGMILANELSVRQGLLSPEEKDDIHSLARELLTSEHLARLKVLNLDSLLELLQKDKKVERQQVSFVLLKTAGEVFFEKMNLDQLLVEKVKDVFRSLK